MSIHLMVVAAYLPPDVVTQGQKLALMKIADSADDETRLARPGMRRLRAWVGVGEKRAITLVTELIERGLVERVSVGKAGRAAVYKVFPLGVPAIPTTDELDLRHALADAAPKNPRKARAGVARARPSKPAMTHEDIEARRQAPEPVPDERSAGPEEGGGEAGFHPWNPEQGPDWVPPVEPSGFHEGNPFLPWFFLCPSFPPTPRS